VTSPAIHDGAVRHLPGRLGALLGIARALAGARGWAHLTWHGQGFTYTLTVVRDPGADPDTMHVEADLDPTGLGGDRDELLDDLGSLLDVTP
jgi:hypothetical protein